MLSFPEISLLKHILGFWLVALGNAWDPTSYLWTKIWLCAIFGRVIFVAKYHALVAYWRFWMTCFDSSPYISSWMWILYSFMKTDRGPAHQWKDCSLINQTKDRVSLYANCVLLDDRLAHKTVCDAGYVTPLQIGGHFECQPAHHPGCPGGNCCKFWLQFYSGATCLVETILNNP